jgi:predicted exporter
MSRWLAILWLLLVSLAGGYLAWRVHQGLALRTDLTALLPREEQNPTLAQANDKVVRALSQKMVLLVGDNDRDRARAAAAELTRRLDRSGLVELSTTGFDKDRLKAMGALYFPYRRGLLAEGDRRALQEGHAESLARRALSQVYGFVGMADAGLLRSDPFLLLPSFFTSLPVPLSRLSLDDGLLSTTVDGTTWILVAGRLTGEPFALDLQKQLTRVLDLDGLKTRQPGLQVLRLGAVFFAQAGADEAIGESTSIGIVSILGTIVLVLAAFRALSPLWLSLLAIGVGVGVALATSLLIFGELHVGALLFGVSLIGVTVDYSLQYCSEIFAPPASPRTRLRRVLVGIALGTATTTIGYLTLLLAPFPGLHQIAAFSAIGLVAAWLTVVLWLPRLDRSRPPRHGAAMLACAGRVWSFWENRRWATARRTALAAACLVAVGGLSVLHADDEVRHLQSPSAVLLDEQDRIQRLIGSSSASQFFLIEAGDDETALQREEILQEKLQGLVADGALAGFQAAARYVPSAARQRDNRRLLAERLDPLLADHLRQLPLTEPPAPVNDGTPVLTLADAVTVGGPLAALSTLVLEPGTHVVTLDGIVRLADIAALSGTIDGVRLVDPTADYSRLLGKYRGRAILLLALSALLMGPLLALRYGLKGTVRILLPSLFAVVLVPSLRALAGASFTFFDAMALVLILSIGVDYAVFCAETTPERKAVTMLAVALAAMTAVLSFGLLALSRVQAVHSFGASMFLGILLTFLLAPLARVRR